MHLAWGSPHLDVWPRRLPSCRGHQCHISHWQQPLELLCDWTADMPLLQTKGTAVKTVAQIALQALHALARHISAMSNALAPTHKLASSKVFCDVDVHSCLKYCAGSSVMVAFVMQVTIYNPALFWQKILSPAWVFVTPVTS